MKKILGNIIWLLMGFFIINLSSFADTYPKTVRIASVAYNLNGQTTFMGSVALAKEAGLEKDLKKLGIEVVWVPAPTANVGPIINESFANETIDFASYGDLPPVILNGSKPRVQLVAPWGRNGNSYLVVPASSNAKTISELKGKRIAIHRGRPWEIAFARLLDSNGLKFSDFKIVNVNPQVGAAALASGSVDAFFTLNDAYLLVDKGVGRIVWSTKNSPPDWKLMGGLWARSDFVQKYPQVTQIVVNNYLKASYWTAQNENQENYFKKYANLAQPESVVRRDYEGDSVAWRDRWSPLYDQSLYAHYRSVTSYAKLSGLVKNDVDVNGLLNPKFVEVALKELHLEGFWSAN